MDPKETINHIAELCEDAGNKPSYLTFQTIAEWAHKQMDYMNAPVTRACKLYLPDGFPTAQDLGSDD